MEGGFGPNTLYACSTFSNKQTKGHIDFWEGLFCLLFGVDTYSEDYLSVTFPGLYYSGQGTVHI